jgi:hypothetical protein
VALVGGILAAPAHGAQYTVITCAGQPAGLAGWSSFTVGTHPSTTSPETCGSGGNMPAVLKGNGATPNGEVGWQIDAPGSTTFAKMTLYRKVVVGGTSYGYQTRETGAGGANPLNIEYCINAAGCAAAAKLAVASWLAKRSGVVHLDARVFCRGTSSAPCQKVAKAEAASLRISRADITLNDTKVPTVASGPTSSMFGAAGAVSGVQSVTVGFKDAGGGIASTGVQVDGATVGEVPVDNSNCRAPYRRLVPCPLSLTTTLQFNPAAVPDGPHQIRVFARDATGANIGYSQSFPVTTSARGGVNGTNGSDQVTLTAGARRAVKAGHHAPRTHSAVTVSYGAKAVVSGRLVNSARQPVIGARLAVASAVDRGVPQFAPLARDVITDKTGRFKFTVPAGPSVRVRVAYFARALDTAPAASRDVRVKVRTKATLRPARRHMGHHRRAVFSGRVYGRYRPPGVRVELQGRRGHSYVTLATAATRPNGTYRLSYRFTRRAHGRYVFRVRVRHYARFPYFLGYSRAVNVFVS